jgi:LPS export ABC transporter protein LptC
MVTGKGNLPMTTDRALATRLVLGGVRTALAPVLAAAALLAGCSDGSRLSQVDIAGDAERVGHVVEHSITVDGVRRAVLRADTARILPAAPLVQLRRVNVEIFTDEGLVLATLTGDAAEYDQAARQLSMRGGVTLSIRSPTPQTVHAEELHYDATTGRVTSDAFTGTLGQGAPSRGPD